MAHIDLHPIATVIEYVCEIKDRMSARQPHPHPEPRGVRIAVDVGGTFTDLVVIDSTGAVHRHKLLSTPPDFDTCVLAGIAKVLDGNELDPASATIVNHGTTVATNAVLERRGARTALITTKGFRDVLELRRIRAPQIYDLFFVKPPAIVDRYLRLELDERMAADGSVLSAVREQDLKDIVETLKRESVESVAVCLLHSYAYPEHEQQVGHYLRRALPDMPVSLSCDVLPQRREYERSATTVVNAYVRPVMRRYLDALQAGLTSRRIEAPLMIMQSAGGLTTAEDAAARPVFSLESGPAAGVLAAAWCCKATGQSNVISFDMGGTTAKTAMIEAGRVPYSSEYEVGPAISAGNRLVGGGGDLILAPSIDIVEVGAGGGSLAYLDTAGGIRVGPRSAGARPGPACYQLGGRNPTVTDANVALGYIKPGPLADGSVTIDANLARDAITQHIAKPLGLELSEAAMGIHRIADAQMLRALREVSTQRGRDPRDFTLVAFGGSGPVHAAGLARELGAGQVIIPPMPGLFSAVGLLVAGIEHHDVRSCQITGDAMVPDALNEHLTHMHTPMARQFQQEQVPPGQVKYTASLDLRYTGQTSELRVALEGLPVEEAAIHRAVEEFEAEHERLYGYRAEAGSGVEALAVRLIGRTPAVAVDDMRYEQQHSEASGAKSRLADFGAPRGAVETPVTHRAALRNGAEGPLLIDEYDTTIVIPPDWSARMDGAGNIVLEHTHGEG